MKRIEREREREDIESRLRSLESNGDRVSKQNKILRIGFIGLCVITILGFTVFNLANSSSADTVVGTCLSVSKGGTGCFDIEFLNKIYPIGAIYTTTVNNNPSEYLGGTWESFGTGQTLVGVDTTQTEFDTVEKSGGEKVHTLTIDEMPSHNHAISGKGAGFSGVVGTFMVGLYSGGPTIPASILSSDNKGGGEDHNNLQPYVTVYFWKRAS